VPTSATPTRLPVGRAIHGPSGHQVQLVHAAGELVPAALAASSTERSGQVERALRLRRLPEVLRRNEIDAWDGADVLLGVGSDDARPIVLDLTEHPRLVVLGPAGSGRSQVLAGIAQQLHERGRRVLAVAPLDGPLRRGDWPVVDDAGTLLRVVAEHSAGGAAVCVLVDDAEEIAHDAALSQALDRLARETGPHSLALAIRTDAGHLPRAAPFLASALRHRTGVLLTPGHPHDGDPLGVRAEPADPAVPGRGVLVVRGAATTVQVAL